MPRPRRAHRLEVDVVVVGGGPAGCATALALAQRSARSILLLDAGAFETTRIGESVPPDIRPLLSRLDLWPAFLAASHRPCHGSRSLWGGTSVGHNDFLSNVHGPGWHLDRRRFDGMLLSALSRAGVEVRLGTRLSAAHTDASSSGIFLEADSPDGPVSAVAHFAVDATGHRAALAGRIGATRQTADRLILSFGRFALPPLGEFPDLTLLEAVENGWWYAARLPDGEVLAGLAEDPVERTTAQTRNPQSWLQELAKSRLVGPHLADGWFVPDSLFRRVAWSSFLEPCVGPAWLAVGDAAASFDPIAAQGILKGLANGIDAADAILAWFEGDPTAIQRYAARRTTERLEYDRAREFFYRQVDRWPGAAFWRRRRDPITSIGRPESPKPKGAETRASSFPVGSPSKVHFSRSGSAAAGSSAPSPTE